MLGEPARSPYDLLLRIFGIPVRVTPFFWLVAVFLGWDLVVSLETLLGKIFGASPHRALILLLWILAVFLSLLIHELGHALAMRCYGLTSHIVIYHFGGLAIPDGVPFLASSGRAQRTSSQIIIAAAGPAAQLLAAALVLAAVGASGHQLLLLQLFGDFWPMPDAPPLANVPLHLAATFFVMPSVFWAGLNLLPVYPLDGGQIAREALMSFGAETGIRRSLALSIVTAGAVALYGFSRGDSFLGIMFALLAYSSYTTLQRYSGRGGGGTPWG